jgi:hypothetical protein
MDSLNTLLGSRDFRQPPEIERLKLFIKENYNQSAEISLNGKTIVVGVASSALASSLRYRLPEIKRTLKIDQKITLKSSLV